MDVPNRLTKLNNSNKITGLDIVYVEKVPVDLGDKWEIRLNLYFYHSYPGVIVKDGNEESRKFADEILDGLKEKDISIKALNNKSAPDVSVRRGDWIQPGRDKVFRIKVEVIKRYCFDAYELRINHDNIDHYFKSLRFSFQAACESDVDCRLAADDCPLEEQVDFAVDYQARDFSSFRRALLDFASQRYPQWKDRLEADMGIMLAEVMSALGDELAYYQDRIAREAHFETATQRRSLRQHARLVDYEIHNGLGASTWLDVTVKPGESGVRQLPAGTDVWALSDEGNRISYEVGRGLADGVKNVTFDAAAARNEFAPHIWDEDDICLPVGATELFIIGKQKLNLTFDDPPEDPSGKWVLLKAQSTNPADPERRWPVRIIKVDDPIRDLVFEEEITRIEWEQDQKLPFELNLARLTVRGNLVPVTAGRTVMNRFTIGVEPASLALLDDSISNLRQAVERGRIAESIDEDTEITNERKGTITYLFSLINPELRDEDKGNQEAEAFLTVLEKPEGKNLTWLGKAPQAARPEIHLAEVELVDEKWVEKKPPWNWRRSLLGVSSSQPMDRHFTLEDGTWDRVVGYQRKGQELVHVDYTSSEGFTIRFGNGEFGRAPAKGTIFQATYRLGNGPAGNVPADAIIKFDQSYSFIEAVTNPLAVDSGMGPQTLEEVRQLAPEEYRHLNYCAVRPEDYAEAAERLPWVQRAGAGLRWTGSWLTLFATPDPIGAVTISDAERRDLNEQLDRFRQAGRETSVAEPRYVDLDLKITICVEPSTYPGEVKEAVLAALSGTKGFIARPGFFAADNFSFGAPLERSALEGVIQAVPGVRAVEAISVRRRGWFDWRGFDELTFEVGLDEVIRVENDPLYPGRGSVRLFMKGGA